MEERTGTELGTNPSPLGAAGTTASGSGLSTLEATERADTSGQGRSATADKARAYAGQAKKLGGMARERIAKQGDTRKSALATELDNFANTLEEVSRQLSERGNQSQKQLVDKGTGYVRQASRFLREKSTDELLTTGEQQIRQRPGVALAGAAALAFLGVRLLKS